MSGLDERLVVAVKRMDCFEVARCLHAGARPSATDNMGYAALYLAAENKQDASIAMALFAAGADVNYGGINREPPLHAASSVCCRALLAFGADVHAVDWQGCTPLHSAAMNASSGVVAQLIAAGADVGKKNELGQTPLHCAAVYGSLDAAAQLIAAGADIEAVDEDNDTPLVTAQFYRNDDMIALLVAGARWRGLRRAALAAWCCPR